MGNWCRIWPYAPRWRRCTARRRRTRCLRLILTTSASATLNLSGALASGSTYVIANPSAGSAILSKASVTSGVASFNGNDALVLYSGSSVVDAIGDMGYDPGSGGWGAGTSTATTDHTLVRKPTVHTGDSNATDSFYPSNQWSGYASDTTSQLGAHTMTCP